MIDPMIFEEWKDIDFLDIKTNAYKISSFGRVYSNLKPGILSPAVSNGYLTIQLVLNDGSRKTFYIHRLVGLAFLHTGGDPNDLEINHKNLYRADCCYINLEWTTKYENIIHELAHKSHNIEQLQAKDIWGNGYKTHGENNGMSKLSETTVRQMLSLAQDGKSYSEILTIVGLEDNPRNRANLSHIVRGHRWSYLQKEYNIPK